MEMLLFQFIFSIHSTAFETALQKMLISMLHSGSILLSARDSRLPIYHLRHST